MVNKETEHFIYLEVYVKALQEERENSLCLRMPIRVESL